jgi:hypothetical protein
MLGTLGPQKMHSKSTFPFVIRTLLLLAFCLHPTFGSTNPQNTVVGVTVAVNTSFPFVTLPTAYLGFTLDWWPPYSEGFGTSTVNLINLTHPRLLGLTSALGPVTLRIGGSLDNVVKYYVGNMSLSECAAPVPFRGEVFPNLCLNMSRMTDVLNFVAGTNNTGLTRGSRLVFGLQLKLDDSGWNATNVIDFLSATSQLQVGKGVITAFEVGEETTPAPSNTEAFSAFIDAYKGVRKAVESFWPIAAQRPSILGPCTGMNDNYAPFNWSLSFLDAVGGDTLEGYVMHSYNNDGGRAWSVPGFLNQTAVQASGIRAMLDTSKHSALPLWCGECGPHNGGGLPNITTRAISSFWYTAALHSLPLLGVHAGFNRQTLSGGSYSLLANDNFAPHPDYFAALAYSTIGSPRVLRTSTHAAGGVNISQSIQTYATCARELNGAVVIVYVNVDPNTTFALTLPGSTGRTTTFIFTPMGGDILSNTLTLNGTPLVVTGNDPPALVGIDGDAADAINANPYSFGYIVYHDMNAAACV